MSKHRANTATDERPLVRHTCIGSSPAWSPRPCPACLPGKHRKPGTVRQHRLRAEREDMLAAGFTDAEARLQRR